MRLIDLLDRPTPELTEAERRSVERRDRSATVAKSENTQLHTKPLHLFPPEAPILEGTNISESASAIFGPISKSPYEKTDRPAQNPIPSN
jgi:hypothetical protein